MFFVTGTNWQLGAGLLVVANLFYAASIVVYDAILVEVAEPDERDRISSRAGHSATSVAACCSRSTLRS